MESSLRDSITPVHTRSMDCPKCSKPVNIKTDIFVVCGGRCCERFHAHCVGLNQATVDVLINNVMWFCNECLSTLSTLLFQTDECQACDGDHVKKHTGPKATEEGQIMSEISILKCQVSDIVKTLEDFAQKMHDTSSPRQSSTPITSSKALDEIFIGLEASCSVGSNINSGAKAKQSFSLLLSNIDNRVTEREIDTLVCNSLGITGLGETHNVTKLVSRWKSCEEMDYISFKVVLDNKWRSIALDASTWPQYIRCREFVSKHRTTWYPAY